MIAVILALGFGACSDNGSPTGPTGPAGPNLDGAVLVATDGVMAAATRDEDRADFGEVYPEHGEPREDLRLNQSGASLSGSVSLYGFIRGGTLDPQLGYLGSQALTGTPIAVDGSIASGDCPCTVRLSGSDVSGESNVSYSLSGTVDADGNRINSQVEIRSTTSFFPTQTGSSIYERR